MMPKPQTLSYKQHTPNNNTHKALKHEHQHLDSPKP